MRIQLILISCIFSLQGLFSEMQQYGLRQSVGEKLGMGPTNIRGRCEGEGVKVQNRLGPLLDQGGLYDT
jgi:hypothetical protein